MDTATAMYGAIARDDRKTVQRLLREDCSVLDVSFLEKSWLHWAAQLGRVEIMEVLVEAGMPIDLLATDGHDTPLAVAAGQGHCQACEWLLDHGAEINHGLGKAATPLFDAIFSRSLELVRLFVSRGANTDAIFGQPEIDVVSYARTHGTPEIITFLEGYRAKRRPRD